MSVKKKLQVEMETRRIDYCDKGVELEGFVAVDPSFSGKRPVVLLFHAWDGRSSFVEQKAIQLAKLGFVGCALDLYGKGVLGKTKEECSSLMGPFIQDRKKLLERISTYRTLLPLIPEAGREAIAAMGFCFGGLCALDLARSGADLKGVVSFHGIFAPPPFESAPIKAKILAFHGYKDPMVTPKDLLSFAEEMDAKKVDFQLHVFGKAMHAFTNPAASDPGFGTVYHEDSAKISWEQAVQFLRAIF